jgi:hypothetical protein
VIFAGKARHGKVKSDGLTCSARVLIRGSRRSAAVLCHRGEECMAASATREILRFGSGPGTDRRVKAVLCRSADSMAALPFV